MTLGRFLTGVRGTITMGTNSAGSLQNVIEECLAHRHKNVEPMLLLGPRYKGSRIALSVEPSNAKPHADVYVRSACAIAVSYDETGLL